MTEVLDAEPVSETEDEHRSEALVPAPQLAVTPAVGAEELVARLDTIKQAMSDAMEDGVDYGRIPGIDKPSLFKPGSEKLGVLFQLDIQIENVKTWGPGDHLTVESKATVYYAPTGARLGYGEGICTTREKKYGKRKQERECPSCGARAIIKGKKEYGGGWVCWKKKDGCGASFKEGDGAIERQEVGEIDNPEIPDTWNTVVKMAEKRARVDAVLAVTGASALFTQDVEDSTSPEGGSGGAGGRAGAGSTSVEPAAAPSVISQERVKDLRALFDRSGMKAADLKLALVSVGIQATSVNDGLSRLSPELADGLEGELKRRADAS